MGLASYLRIRPGQPMAVHTCAVPYGTVSVGRRGLQITLVVVVSWLACLVCLVCLTNPCYSQGFWLMPWLVNICFTGYV